MGGYHRKCPSGEEKIRGSTTSVLIFRKRQRQQITGTVLVGKREPRKEEVGGKSTLYCTGTVLVGKREPRK